MVLQGFARSSQENAMFFDTFDVPAEALWNPASDPRSPSPGAPCYQEAMLFLSQPFLLAFRCGGVTNKRGGAGRPQARSPLIIEEGGPSNASCWFSQALLFFGSPSVLQLFAPFSIRTGERTAPASHGNGTLGNFYRHCPGTGRSEPRPDWNDSGPFLVEVVWEAVTVSPPVPPDFFLCRKRED